MAQPDTANTKASFEEMDDQVSSQVDRGLLMNGSGQDLKKRNNQGKTGCKRLHNTCGSDIDGGYGWVIVTASFFNAFIIDGIGSSFGLLLPYMKTKFDASDFVMSFANSLFMAFLIMGTVSVHLTNRFGVRIITIVGGLLACGSFICSAYVPNVFVFILFYGLAAGCACGLVFLPSIIIVNAYFHNLRGVANGIICAGSGAGLVVLSPLIQYLLENYTLEGTILILSGIMLNMCVFSSLYRPPPQLDSQNRDSSNCSSSNLYLENIIEPLEIGLSSMNEEPAICEERNNVNQKHLDKGDAVNNTEIKNFANTNLKLKASLGVTRNGCHRLIELNKPQQKSPWKSEYHLKSEVDEIDHSFHSSVYNLPTWYNTSHNALVLRKKTDGKRHNKLTSAQHHLVPQDWAVDNGSQLYLAGSIATLRSLQQKHVQSQIHVPSASQQLSNSPKFKFKSSDLPVDQAGAQHLAKVNGLTTEQPEVNLLLDHKDVVSQFTSGHLPSVQSVHLGQNSLEKNNNSEDSIASSYSLGQLLCLPSFHLFYLGASLIQIGYPIAGTFLANYARQLNHNNTALLMSLLGALNICGRCLSGALASLRVDPFHLNNISLLLVGLSCLLCPVYQEFWTLCLFAAFYGFFLGFFPPLQPLIIVKEFGLGSLATAFGFLTTIKGLASFPGAPLAGWIHDETKDYTWSFVFGGSVFFLSGLVHYLMMCVKK